MRVVALLRGMNTGGVRFRMQDLSAALTASGFGGVRTVLASGNVVLDAETPQAAAAGVHDVLLEAFGFDLAVVAVPMATIAAAVAAHPFARSDERHAYVVFATDPGTIDELAAEADGLDPAAERVRAGDGVLHWDVPKGATLDSAFGKRLGRRVKAGTVTTRNLRTLERILDAG